MSAARVRTCLWYDGKAEEAATFYVSLLPGSRIERMQRVAGGRIVIVDFTLAGTPYQAFDGGPHFALNEAASISVLAEDQAETDRLWAALTADGGAESMCGWLKDRFGLSWQIVPKDAMALLANPDPELSGRAMKALMTMRRIDLSALERAAAGA
ncbi:MAG: VOC family protein [Hyphomicrobiales bacterium]